MNKSSRHDSRDSTPAVVSVGAPLRGLIAGLVLLLPTMTRAESHIVSGAATDSLRVTAHLNFKIVIPKVLYLSVASEDHGSAGAPTVAIMSTGRDVTLNATVRAPAARVPASLDAATNSIVLTASARKSIAQNVPCTRGDGPTICTVSMP